MILARDFRGLLGRFATGVTVVTAQWQGETHGMTVNSFTSVSLAPPLILFCSTPDGRTLQLIEQSRHFAVNILTYAQKDVCRRFAGQTEHPEGDRFQGLDYRLGSASQSPVLAGCLGSLECRVVRIDPAGDHRLVLGEVLALEAGGNEEPLLFFEGGYPRLQAGGG